MNRADRDFQTIRTSLIRLRETLTQSWTTRSPRDLGIVLLELFAYVGDQLNYAIDRLTEESILELAKWRSSIVDIVRGFGFPVNEGSPARGEVVFSGAQGTEIPAGTRVATEGGVEFRVLEGGEISWDGTVRLAVRQWKLYENELAGVSDGTKLMRYKLGHRGVDYDSVNVFIRDNAWTQVNDFYSSGAMDNHFCVRIEDNGDAYIVFGDGVSGAIPQVGENIIVNYCVHEGSKGNVPAGAINQMVDKISGVDSVTNPEPTTGGLERDSGQRIKSAFNLWLRSMRRGVTEEDIRYFVESMPAVAAARVRVFWNTVIVYPVATTGTTLGMADKQDLLYRLKQIALMNQIYEVRDPVFVPVDINIWVRCHTGYGFDEVKARIEASVKEFVSPVRKREFKEYIFGRGLEVSDLYEVVEKVEGVDASRIQMLVNGVDVGYSVAVKEDEVVSLGTLVIRDIKEYQSIADYVKVPPKLWSYTEILESGGPD